MFGLFESVVCSAVSVVDDMIHLEAPSKRDIVKLIDAGMTIAAAAEVTNLSIELIERLLEE